MSGPLSTRSVLATGTFSLTAFGVLAAFVLAGRPIPWDAAVIAAIPSTLHDQRFVGLSVVLSILGAVGVLVVLLLRRRFGAVCTWCIALAGVLSLDPLLKHTFVRAARNPESSSLSFPSGSAMLSVVLLAGFVALFPAGRRRAVVLVGSLLVLAQGAILVSAGWHYPSDVAAGWCVGIAWLSALWLAASVGAFGAVARRWEVVMRRIARLLGTA